MVIAENINQIQQKIARTAAICQREADTIQVLAVSKGQPASAIREAFAAGLNNFGENYWQEAQTKIQMLADLPVTWHFIGSIQSNKVHDIAPNFSWVHSLDREQIAELLSKYRPAHLSPLNICLQVNLDDEESKSGLSMQQAAKLAQLVKQLPHLSLRGLMAIPKPQLDEQAQYESLLRLSKLFNQLNKELNLGMDTLSMGMSDDFEAAIRAGSTILRIGRAIFGERPNNTIT